MLDFLGDDFMVPPVVSGSTVDTFVRQSTVAFGRDASGKCRYILRFAWSVSGYMLMRQFPRLLARWYFYGPLYLAVDCSTLSVPEEYNTWIILGDDFRMDAVFSSLLGSTVETSLRQLRRLLEFSPAALVVDIGSGMCWLFCWLRYTSCCVSFDVAVRGDSTGAVLEQVVALAVEARGDSTCAVLGQGDMPVWCYWSDSAENCGFSAVACHRWSLTSWSWCRSRFPWFFLPEDHRDSATRFFSWWSMHLLCRSCSLSAVVHDRCPWF